MRFLKSNFTVYFEYPFWVGVCEILEDEKLEVAKIVFGAEPKNNEIYEYLLKNWSRLNFCDPIEADEPIRKKANPKRVQRQINKQLSQLGIRTKAQEALQLQYEQEKVIIKKNRKLRDELEEQRKFELKQLKKKQKHKGH
jgi:hypothetical protein